MTTRESVGLVMATSLASACGFTPSTAPVDGVVIPDTGIDTPPLVLPKSCAEIHTMDTGQPSGSYMIDPDGDGGDPPLTVTCDMTTEGGGWTIVFYPRSTNLAGTTVGYSASTPRLLGDAQNVLITYRDANLAPVQHRASFPMPVAWRTAAPFEVSGTDVPVNVSVDGGAASSHMLRFGKDSFTDTCTDTWSSQALWGRICITGTNAPYFTGFVVADADTCSDSSMTYIAADCSPALRFSIAVH